MRERKHKANIEVSKYLNSALVMLEISSTEGLQAFPIEKFNLCMECGGEATSRLTSVDTRFEWLVKHVTTALSKFSTCCSFI